MVQAMNSQSLCIRIDIDSITKSKFAFTERLKTKNFTRLSYIFSKIVCCSKVIDVFKIPKHSFPIYPPCIYKIFQTGMKVQVRMAHK